MPKYISIAAKSHILLDCGYQKLLNRITIYTVPLLLVLVLVLAGISGPLGKRQGRQITKTKHFLQHFRESSAVSSVEATVQTCCEAIIQSHGIRQTEGGGPGGMAPAASK